MNQVIALYFVEMVAVTTLVRLFMRKFGYMDIAGGSFVRLAKELLPIGVAAIATIVTAWLLNITGVSGFHESLPVIGLYFAALCMVCVVFKKDPVRLGALVEKIY